MKKLLSLVLALAMVLGLTAACAEEKVTLELMLHKGEVVAALEKAVAAFSQEHPEIEIKMPETILAKNTITSMQAGIMYGTVGQTEYIIRKIKEESGISDIKVVATGGLGRIVADATDSIDVYDAHLTLQGIRLIYEKTKAARQKG